MYKVGIFDSGVGGLIIARAIYKLMPEYDYVYLGDTKRVPYGNRSHDVVHEFTRQGVKYLFEKENCRIVIIACNTASARAAKEIQTEFDKKNRKVLNVLVPAAELAGEYERVGILATRGTVNSGAFIKETVKRTAKDKKIKQKDLKIKIFQNPAPLLVPLAEEGDKKNVKIFLKEYLAPLLKKKIDALVLGCTHYPIFKNEIKKLVPKNVKIISQDEIVPKSLKDYFKRHPEIESVLSKNRQGKGKMKVLVTDLTQNVKTLSQKWFGKNTKPKLVKISK
jgi:glutamate racemase